MITKETLLKLLSLAEEYWATSNTRRISAMYDLLDEIGYEDDDDAVYELAHICAKRGLTIDTYISALKTLGFEIGGDDNA